MAGNLNSGLSYLITTVNLRGLTENLKTQNPNLGLISFVAATSRGCAVPEEPALRRCAGLNAGLNLVSHLHKYFTMSTEFDRNISES